MRNTKQRRIILEELQGLDSHPGADELYALVRKRIPRISLGTVYRNLEMLSREGMIRRLELGGSVKRFDGDTREHQHLRCRKCGRVDDFPVGMELTDCDREMLEGTGYRSLERRIEFIGICPDCAKESESR
jgi:Fur family ferric uptake transcriptional regulator